MEFVVFTPLPLHRSQTLTRVPSCPFCSTQAVDRDQAHRRRVRNHQIQNYMYGQKVEIPDGCDNGEGSYLFQHEPTSDLSFAPSSTVVSFDDITIYRIGGGESLFHNTFHFYFLPRIHSRTDEVSVPRVVIAEGIMITTVPPARKVYLNQQFTDLFSPCPTRHHNFTRTESMAPSSALPIGASRAVSELLPLHVDPSSPSSGVLNSVLALLATTASDGEQYDEEIVDLPVYGFIIVCVNDTIFTWSNNRR